MSTSIRALLQSCNDETEQLIDGYSIKGTMDSDNFASLISLMKSYLESSLIKKTSTIKLNIDAPYTLHNIDDIKSSDNFPLDIEIKFHKNDTDNLIVFSMDSLVETIQKNLTNKVTMIDTINKFFKKNIILVEHEISDVITYVNGEITATEYLFEVSKIIQFASSEQLEVSPHTINIENIKNCESPIIDKFYTLANGLKNYLSLVYIASSIDIKDDKIKIIFDGDRERYFELSGQEIIDEFSKLNKYKELFFWIYKKESDSKNQNFIEKLEIVRNLMAITFVEEKSLIKLNDSVYDILKKSTSSYKIYLKSKTKDYFELRFKIEEHTDKLFNSLGDEFSKFSDFFRNNLYIFVGLIFSSVIFTLIRSQAKNIENSNHSNIFLNQDLSTVISIYGFFSLLVLLISAIKVFSNIDDLNEKLKSIKNKYKSFMDKKDLETIIGNSFEKRKKKNTVWIWGIIVIWVSIGIALIFNSQVYHQFNTEKKSTKMEQVKKNTPIHDLNISIKKTLKHK